MSRLQLFQTLSCLKAVGKWLVISPELISLPLLWWNSPPHVTVWLGSVYIALCWPQHFLLPSSILHVAEGVSCSEASCTPRGCAMQRLLFPRFTGFLGPVWSILWYSLSYVVLPSSHSSVRCWTNPRCLPTPCRPGISTTRIPLPVVPTHSYLQRPQRHSIRSHYKNVFIVRQFFVRYNRLQCCWFF